MGTLLFTLLMLLKSVVDFFQLVMTTVGAYHLAGIVGVLVAWFLVFGLKLSLLAAIGTFYTAFFLWNWSWWWAVLITAPGLVFIFTAMGLHTLFDWWREHQTDATATKSEQKSTAPIKLAQPSVTPTKPRQLPATPTLQERGLANSAKTWRETTKHIKVEKRR